MTANVNYTFISNGVIYTYKYDNTGSYSEAQSVSVSNSVNDTNVTVNTSSITIQNSTCSFTLRLPNSFQIASGSYTLNANGSWTAGGGGGSGNGSLTQVNTGFGLTGGPIDTTGTISVLANSGIVANATGTFVNSAYIATLAANSASYLGGNSASDLIGKSNDAYSNAVATAASDATSKAATAYSNAISTAASDATSKAATAYSNAVSTAASDATSKAATAYSNAVSDASTDASSKAATAYSNATSYADTKAATAYTNATSYADTKAATAYSNATSYADTKAATAYSNAVSTAASDATSKAATAYTNAVSYVDGKSYVNTSQLSANLANYQTTAGLAANVATLAANSATYLGSVNSFGNSSGIYTTLNINALSYSIGTTLTINATTLFYGNSTVNTVINSSSISVKSIIANGSLGSNGQTIKTNGSTIYWGDTGGILPVMQQYTANGTQTSFTVTGGYVANQISVYLNGIMLRNGVDVDVSSGSTFTISPAVANGSLIDVVGISSIYSNNVSAIVSQQFTANGTANSFTITGGYLPNTVIVFLNGVKQIPGTDVIITSGNTVNFTVTPANSYVVDVFGYLTSVSYYSNTLIVGNVSIGTDLITVGNSTVNTQILAGNLYLNGSTLKIGNSTVNVFANSSTLSINGNNISPVQSFRNKIINGNFVIWQRGTSTSTAGYLADRWQTYVIGSTFTSSRQSFTIGQTSVPYEPTYWHRTVVTSSAGAGNCAFIQQPIESVRTLAGQTATLSFWAKADASKNIAVELVQNFGTGGSPSSTVTGIGVTTCALTTSWTKYTVTVNISSISGKTLGSNNDDYLGVYIWFDAGSTFNSRTNSLGQQSGTFDIAQVQLEPGSFATPFEQRLIGTEMSLCQRYYYKRACINPEWLHALTCVNIYRSTTISFPVQMRTSPTITWTYAEESAGGTISTISTQDAVQVRVDVTNSGYWAYLITLTASAEY